MYSVKMTSLFKKDLKRVTKSGYNISLLEAVVECLSQTGTLPEKYRDHALVGNRIGYRECHITPDWLLVYKIDDDVLVLTLTRTGTHSAMFGK